MSVVPLTKKRKLAQKVVLDGYYCDGLDLYEIVGISTTGAVTVQSARARLDRHDGSLERCFDILEFRKQFWLVQPRRNTEGPP